jgi:hypothetical protein
MPLPERSPGASREGGKNEDNTEAGLFGDVLRVGTFPFWCLCFLGGGVAGVLVDLDHIPRYIFGITWLPHFVPHLGSGRFLHPFSFLVGCGVFACAGRYLLTLVLRDLRIAREARRIIRAHEARPKAVYGKSPGYKKSR